MLKSDQKSLSDHQVNRFQLPDLEWLTSYLKAGFSMSL